MQSNLEWIQRRSAILLQFMNNRHNDVSTTERIEKKEHLPENDIIDDDEEELWGKQDDPGCLFSYNVYVFFFFCY